MRMYLSNMQKFKVDQPLLYVTFAYFVTHIMSKEDKRIYCDAFNAIDKTKTGLISKKDIALAWEYFYDFKIDPFEIDSMFRNIDISMSGTIEFSEFVLAVVNKNKILTKENVAWIFSLIDREKTNSISKFEMK